MFAAIATQWGGKYGGRTQMSQAQASDQWAFYQAKSIKQHLDEVALAELTCNADSNNPAWVKAVRKLSDDLARYDEEKQQIRAKAEGLEKIRDDSSRRGGKLGLAVSSFSLAIASASICMVTKKKPLWFVAMALSVLALVQMIWAWAA